MRHLQGTIQNYAWGSTTAIPELLGVHATGEPMAEYWLGAHTSAPSQFSDGTALDAEISRHPEELGAASRHQFGDQLSFLMKVLAAAQPLSLQSHPTREQAEDGFARENEAGIALDDPTRTYKDDWPKPEMVVALTEYHALCGFREPTQTLRLVDAIGLRDVLGDLFAPLSARGGEAALQEVFLAVLQLEDLAPLILELKAAAERHAEDAGEVGAFAQLVLRLVKFYPEDPGTVAALLMNEVVLQPGEAVHLGAGNLHCYLEGTGIEIMANSDNVVRGGLTPKHIDVDELVRVVSFRPGPPDRIPATPAGQGLVEYAAHEPEFRLWRFDVADTHAVHVPASESARIVLLLAGEVTDGSTSLTMAQSAFLPAGEQCTLSGSGYGFIAASGASASEA